MTQAASAGRRKPGPVPTLSRAKVIATGLEVLAREGVRSVSFRTVALRLGVAPNALYTYVADKDDLINGMMMASMEAVDLPTVGDPRSGREQLVSMLCSMRSVLIDNAELFNVTTNSADTARWMLDSFEQLATILREINPDERKAAGLYMALVDLTVGSALTTARANANPTDPDEVLDMVDANRSPKAYALGSAAFELDRGEVFERALNVLLDAER